MPVVLQALGIALVTVLVVASLACVGWAWVVAIWAAAGGQPER